MERSIKQPVGSSAGCFLWERNSGAVGTDRIPEGGAEGAVFDGKGVQDGLADVGKGGAGAEIHAGAERGSRRKEGGVLPGVVGAGGGGVAAMVGGDEKGVLLFQLGEKAAEPAIEAGHGGGVAVHVVAVAVLHVKIHQIDKAQAGEVLLEQGGGLFHAV